METALSKAYEKKRRNAYLVERKSGKFEEFVEILNAVDEATSDEDIMDYFEDNGFML